jgi:dienelactone hydrolase
MPTARAYGSWPSPLTAADCAQGSVRLGQMVWDPPDLYWIESRPQEQGRAVLMRWQGAPTEVLPSQFHVRTTVHEYGGGAFTVQDGTVVFSHYPDQRLYLFSQAHPQPLPLTPEGFRYGDGCLHQGYWIGIREDHRGTEVINCLVRVALDGSDQETGGQILHSGHDFYASPRLSPTGTLAWITWDHPAMPWDRSTLWIAYYEPVSGSLNHPLILAGAENESVQQPRWTSSSSLIFISDRTGWWNLYSWDPQQGIRALYPLEAEFGQPPWVLGLSTYCLLADTEVLCIYSQAGVSHLLHLDLTTGQGRSIPVPYTFLDQIQGSRNQAFFLGGSPTTPLSVVALDLKRESCRTLRPSSTLPIPASYCSVPQPVTFASAQGRTAYGFYYPPTHPDYTGLPGERPPVLVKTHGGPTAATTTVLSLGIQFWTSRGWGIFDVNYGGSSGYGRAYREVLRGQWGIVDAEDVVAGCAWLVSQGLADPQRLVISGGSAGGFTTLVALTFYECFRAGGSYYGIGDLAALARDTHKFESHYLDTLVGPYPQAQAIYQERSPIYHTDRLACPVIFFQGQEDRVVPPNQAEAMVAALKKKGIPVEYLSFANEGHGFRQASTLETCLEAELAFYQRVLGIPQS